jgi:hypothetical protein
MRAFRGVSIAATCMHVHTGTCMRGAGGIHATMSKALMRWRIQVVMRSKEACRENQEPHNFGTHVYTCTYMRAYISQI